MALDGIVIANIVAELQKLLAGGRIDKIYQPEKDEIIISIRSLGNTYKLLMTAHASHPRLHITQKSKANPMTAPLFCMVLRKHMSGGKLIQILQPNFERIVELHFESLNEMGDLTVKKLIIEIMGKHSNIMLVDEQNTILDSIKHISKDKSAVREVLPGRMYVYPPAQEKDNPMDIEWNSFVSQLEKQKKEKIHKAIYQSYSGISPAVAGELCVRAHVDGSTFAEELQKEEQSVLYKEFEKLVLQVQQKDFEPQIFIDEKKQTLIDFSSIDMKQFFQYKIMRFDTISMLLEHYYYERDHSDRIRQKSYELKKLIEINMDRCAKKKQVHLKTLEDVSKRDKWKIAGELITANIYMVKQGMTELITPNFYEEDQKIITISLDSTLTPAENAQKYFRKYQKAKRTHTALQEQMKQNEQEINYLETLLTAIETSTDDFDIADIQNELVAQGYIKKKKSKKNDKNKKSKPLHFKSKDGLDIYVGKNNTQNDELTLRFALPYDLWFHTKEIPGSHVIIRTNGQVVSDETLVEAANLAAYYSKAKNSSHVPVDYTIRKHVKKPNGAKPGMVIYENNKTIYITPDETKIETLQSE